MSATQTPLSRAHVTTWNGWSCPACGGSRVSVYTADSVTREDCADLLECESCGLSDFPLTTEGAAVLVDNRERARHRHALPCESCGMPHAGSHYLGCPEVS